MVADDPGPISSQTEQDTRTFAAFSKVPVFDPSSVKEAFSMMKEAFAFSEKWGTPVIFRTTTRVDHGYESIDIPDESEYEKHEAEGFIKDASRFVIFPKLSVKNHALIEKRNAEGKNEKGMKKAASGEKTVTAAKKKDHDDHLRDAAYSLRVHNHEGVTVSSLRDGRYHGPCQGRVLGI